jgi:hypothetical protein
LGEVVNKRMKQALSIATMFGLIAYAWVLLGGPKPAGSRRCGEPSSEESDPVCEPRPMAAIVSRQMANAQSAVPRMKLMNEAQVKRLRATMLASITKAPTPDGEPVNPGKPKRPAPPTDLQAAIEEIRPLLRECYELGQKERPELREATAMVSLSIIGDEQLGGVVEQSTIDEGSENMTPAFSECVRETMYRLKLREPEGRGRVLVIYPLRFGVTAAPETNPGATPEDAPIPAGP